MSGSSSSSLPSMAEPSSSHGPATAASSSSSGSAAAGSSSSNHIPADASSSGSHAAAASSSSSGSSAMAAGSSSGDYSEAGPSAPHNAISALAPIPSEAPLLAALSDNVDHIVSLKAKLDWHKSEMKRVLLQQSNLAQSSEDKKEKKTIIYTEADVPGFVADLPSPDEKLHNKAAGALAHICDFQKDIVHSAVLQHLPSIISLIPIAPDDVRSGSLIRLVHHIGCASLESQIELRKHLDLGEVIKLLLKPTPDYACVAVRGPALGLLETVMHRIGSGCNSEVDEKIESQVIEILHTRLYKFEVLEEKDAENDKGKGSGKGKAKAPETIRWNTDDALSAIKALDFAVRERGTSFCVASLKAGAIEFLLQIATTPSSESASSAGGPGSATTLSSLRVAAVSCLSELYLAIVEQYILPEDLPHLAYQEDARLDLQGRILMPLLDIIDDADLPVSDKIVQLLFKRFNDLDQAVEIFLWTHEGSMDRLIHKLAIGSAGGGDPGRGMRGGRPGSGLMEMLLGGMGPPGIPGGQGGHRRLPSAAELLARPFPPEIGGHSEGDYPSLATDPAFAAYMPSAIMARARERQEAEVRAHITLDKGPSLVETIGEAANTETLKEGEGRDVEMQDAADKTKEKEQEAVEEKEEAPVEEQEGGAVEEKESPLVEMLDAGSVGESKGKGKVAATEPTDSHVLGKDEDAKMSSPTQKRSFDEILNLMAGIPPADSAIPHKSPKREPVLNLAAPTGGLNLSGRFLSMLDRISTSPKTELLFESLIGHNPDGVREAFATFWAREDLEESVREGLVRELSGIHGSVRIIATSAGVPVPSECVKQREKEHEPFAAGGYGSPIGVM